MGTRVSSTSSFVAASANRDSLALALDCRHGDSSGFGRPHCQHGCGKNVSDGVQAILPMCTDNAVGGRRPGCRHRTEDRKLFLAISFLTRAPGFLGARLVIPIGRDNNGC